MNKEVSFTREKCESHLGAIDDALYVIGGKWKPPLIWILLKGPMRFGELGKMMPDIALKVLSRQLKELEAEGIVIRKAYPEVPPRVEYSLSKKGESLRDIMELMSEWSRKNISTNSREK